MKESKFEQPKKFTLENLIPLDENSEKVKLAKLKLKIFSEAGIEWPIEMMGGGQSNYTDKTFEIYYPIGDIFCSYAVILHELGHLRQGEIDEKFSSEELGAPEPKKQDKDYHLESERDAFERGLRRMMKYAPEVLARLEQKFQMYKKQGKMQNFIDFNDFFSYLLKVSLKGSVLHDSIGYGNAETEDDIRLKTVEWAELLKSDPITNDFFTNQEKWKVGELIDREEAESTIRKIVSKVAEEQYK